MEDEEENDLKKSNTSNSFISPFQKPTSNYPNNTLSNSVSLQNSFQAVQEEKPSFSNSSLVPNSQSTIGLNKHEQN